MNSIKIWCNEFDYNVDKKERRVFKSITEYTTTKYENGEDPSKTDILYVLSLEDMTENSFLDITASLDAYKNYPTFEMYYNALEYSDKSEAYEKFTESRHLYEILNDVYTIEVENAVTTLLLF